MRKFMYLLAGTLLALAAPGCDILNQWGNAWGNTCPATDDGNGGDDGSGGGGDDTGNGGDTSGDGLGGTSTDTGTGVDTGTGTSTDPGAGTETDTGIPTDPGQRRPPRHGRRPRRSPRLGVAYQADCTPLNVPPPPSSVPSWQDLDTAKLRTIAIANNINGCANQTGITQSRSIGVAFETWALKTMGKLPRWKTLIPSAQRKQQNNGLPASVIPEFVDQQIAFTWSAPLNLTWDYFPNSLFYEVKAVTGNITLGTSQYQILGLLDVATSFPTVPAGPHAPPAVVFVTTSNTVISPSVVTKAISWKVAVWQYTVQYDANSATPNNPLLRIGTSTCLTPILYPTQSLVLVYWLDPGASMWPNNPLTWPTDAEQASVVVPGDPDPAEVN